MKSILSSRGLFLFGFVILIFVNIIVLTGVAHNRSGTPDAMVVLTERELGIPYHSNKENSGMSLQLKWRVLGKERDDTYYYGYYGRTPEWFDVNKLKEVGFREEETIINPYPYRKHKKPVSKEILVVLEYDGALYQKAVARAEALFEKATTEFESMKTDKIREGNLKTARDRLKGERTTESRLFAIDAGRDPETLRAKYPDTSRFIITPAVVRVQYTYEKKKRIPYGYISRLSVESINVPLKIRNMFETVLKRDKIKVAAKLRPPRYKVKLAYGQRYEPWIESIQKTNE